MARDNKAILNISLKARSELDSIKTEGQSDDDIIRELVKFWKQKKKDYWTRRKEAKKAILFSFEGEAMPIYTLQLKKGKNSAKMY